MWQVFLLPFIFLLTPRFHGLGGLIGYQSTKTSFWPVQAGSQISFKKGTAKLNLGEGNGLQIYLLLRMPFEGNQENTMVMTPLFLQYGVESDVTFCVVCFLPTFVYKTYHGTSTSWCMITSYMEICYCRLQQKTDTNQYNQSCTSLKL